MNYYSPTSEGITLRCHVQPKASRDALAGIHDERLKIQITAPPADGKANKHLISYLAKTLGIAKSRISLVNGESSRKKTLFIEGLKSLPAEFPAP